MKNKTANLAVFLAAFISIAIFAACSTTNEEKPLVENPFEKEISQMFELDKEMERKLQTTTDEDERKKITEEYSEKIAELQEKIDIRFDEIVSPIDDKLIELDYKVDDAFFNGDQEKYEQLDKEMIELEDKVFLLEDYSMEFINYKKNQMLQQRMLKRSPKLGPVLHTPPTPSNRTGKTRRQHPNREPKS